jgi:hypothetical protein
VLVGKQSLSWLRAAKIVAGDLHDILTLLTKAEFRAGEETVDDIIVAGQAGR